MILALFALTVLVALPIYLLRRPRPIVDAAADAGVLRPTIIADAGVTSEEASAAAAVDAGASGKRLTLSEVKTIRCTPKGGRRASFANADRCERVTMFEDALARSIRDNIACAPPSAAPFTVSFVLTVDVDRTKLHLWAGRSGTLKRRAANDLIRCVEHAIAPPDWNAASHQYAKYEINVIASYPGNGVTGGSSLGGT